MKPLGLALIAVTQYSGAPSPAQSIRVAYAKQLYLDTMTLMVGAGEDAASLIVEVHGEYGQVIYIQDNGDSAKEFYIHMSGDENTRSNLLRMGFRMVVLVNAKHGTFVVDLMDYNMVKPDEIDA